MANTSKRGFASMDPSKQREIASKGGRAAHAKGTAHEFTSEEARVAGRKGGEAVSRDRAHMSAIGREGGHSRGARARAGQSNGGSSDVARGNNEDRTSNEGLGRAASASDRGNFGTSERSSNNQSSGNNGSRNSSERDRDRDRDRLDSGSNPERFQSRDEI